MAVSTLTTLNDLTLASAVLEQAIVDYARAAAIMRGLVASHSLAGKMSKAAVVPKWASLAAAGLTEGNDMSNTTLSTDGVTITAGEVGVRVDITDMVQSFAGGNMDAYARQCGLAIADKWDDDLCALFSGLSTSVGSSGTELTLDVLHTAIYTLEAAKAPKDYAFVLHPRQVLDIRTLIAGASGSTATFFANPANGVDVSVKPGALVGTFMGVPVYQDANVDTANAGADYLGALFAVGSCFAEAVGWEARVELQRDASARAMEINAVACYGVAEIVDTFGVGILSKAAV